jgi:hypothetical protein
LWDVPAWFGILTDEDRKLPSALTYLHFLISMKEYQAVVVKLTRHTREDEDTLTDLLNERSRGGWEPALMSQDEHRLIILFQRNAVAEG